MSLHTGLDERRAADLPSFSVGGILWRSFWITLWNFFRFVGLALVIAVPAVALGLLFLVYGHVDARIDIEDFRIVSAPGETLAYLVTVFVSLLVTLMVQAAVAYRTFRSLGGYAAEFGDCLARSLGVMLHLGELAVVASIRC
jgi:multisubunit Na+/H+ antiporter MnhB subunit